MADKEEMTNSRSDYIIELRTLSDVIKKAFKQNLLPIIENFKTQQEKVRKLNLQSTHKLIWNVITDILIY